MLVFNENNEQLKLIINIYMTRTYEETTLIDEWEIRKKKSGKWYEKCLK